MSLHVIGFKSLGITKDEPFKEKGKWSRGFQHNFKLSNGNYLSLCITENSFGGDLKEELVSVSYLPIDDLEKLAEPSCEKEVSALEKEIVLGCFEYIEEFYEYDLLLRSIGCNALKGEALDQLLDASVL